MEIKDIISSGLLELYAMGLASPQEQHDVESWMNQYPEVAAEVDAIEAGLETYAIAHAIEPAENVKNKILANITKTAISKPLQNGTEAIVRELPITHDNVRTISSSWKWVAAASILLLVGSVATNFIYYNKYNSASKDAVQAQNLLTEQQQKNADMTTDLSYVHNPNSMPVSLKEMGKVQGATAKIFWMQDTKKVMIDASNLPDAPTGMQYQFWAIVDGKPVSGGMIITNDKGKKYRMQEMRSFGNVQAFAISLEKEGGSQAPTEVVSMGKII